VLFVLFVVNLFFEVTGQSRPRLYTTPLSFGEQSEPFPGGRVLYFRRSDREACPHDAARGDQWEGQTVANKNKTKRCLKKRFKITGTGKIKRRKCGKRHLNAHMTGKRIRQLRGATHETGPIADKIVLLMGGL
jgi:large subunit ribosomal protein L35